MITMWYSAAYREYQLKIPTAREAELEPKRSLPFLRYLENF